MSGTSGDGVDAALVELIDGPHPRVTLRAHRHRPFPESTRDAVLRAGSGASLTAAGIAELHAALGDAYAAAALEVMAGSPRPSVIGVHGQTIAHLPARAATLQIGDAARVAVRTGIATVSDFRSADVAAGGQGAPLTPFADHLLFADGTPRVIVNLGGIANLTLLPDADPAHVRGFDSGPGNAVLDAVARLGGMPFDRDGAGARRGRVAASALERALEHPYFARRAPKSTGREDFGDAFAADLVRDVRDAGGTLDDALATATALTARTVADALRREAPDVPWLEALVAGGGAANPALVDALVDALAPIAVRRTDAVGVPAAAREAMAFALLALYRVLGRTNTLPRCTGASRAVRAGVIHEP